MPRGRVPQARDRIQREADDLPFFVFLRDEPAYFAELLTALFFFGEEPAQLLERQDVGCGHDLHSGQDRQQLIPKVLLERGKFRRHHDVAGRRHRLLVVHLPPAAVALRFFLRGGLLVVSA